MTVNTYTYSYKIVMSNISFLNPHSVHICNDKLLMTGSTGFINYYWLISGLPG